ncbi:MAG: MMPL family transporter [Thermodesulfobacteriota bacterium]|nr:MMPL family transporter [Thermodesulfobacteriota bacterium]
MDNSNEAFFLEGDPAKLLLDKFRDTFGNEDFVYVLIETDDFFRADTIRLIKKLAEDLEAHVPYVKDMKFLGNVEYMEGVEGGIEISDLIEGVPETHKGIRLVREKAMNEPLCLDNLISRDGRTAAILLECERYPEEKVDPRKKIPPVVYKILAKLEYADLEIYMEYYNLPETSDQAAEYLFLYETSGGEELDKQVSFNYDTFRIQTRSKSLSAKDVRSFISDVNRFVKANIGPGIKLECTGTMTFVKAMADYVGEGQIKCFIWAFLAITLMMIITLRSFKLGLISMIPNVFPVLISLGLMGLLGIYMSIPLMIFTPIIIGVAVDDTIHFFMRYRRKFNRTGTYEGTLKATLSTVGRPIMFTTMTLVVGFSVFGLSDMYTQVQFGLLSVFAFIWALLADFFLAPAMMLLFKPLGAESQVSMDN